MPTLSAQYICKECRKQLPLSSSAVLAHYEKYHFSTYAANRATMEKHPQFFLMKAGSVIAQTTSTSKGLHLSCGTKLKDVKEATAIHVHVDPKVAQARAGNQKRIEGILSNGVNYSHPYRGKSPYECPCCKRTLSSGTFIRLANEKSLTLCRECYSVVRNAIPKRERKPRIEYYPVGGQSSWQKH